MFFNSKKENLRKIRLKIQTKAEIEKFKKYIKKMSSLRNEISFENKEMNLTLTMKKKMKVNLNENLYKKVYILKIILNYI